MNIKSVTPFRCDITIGMTFGYTGEPIPDQSLYESIREAQDSISISHIARLSCKVTPCKIVFLGQLEESVK